jgi:hypothetical protein
MLSTPGQSALNIVEQIGANRNEISPKAADRFLFIR